MKDDAKLAVYTCKICGKTFNDGRKLGGHVRQSHPTSRQEALQEERGGPDVMDGASATKVLQMWKSGADPFDIVTSLSLHPRYVKEVLKEFDELLNEWKRFKEA